MNKRQIVIEAPNPNYGPDDLNKVFLGGGISDCPDWQDYVIRRLKGINCDFVLYNPRRAGFDVTNPNESVIQIDWEHKHLDKSDTIIFWFPKETLCPITLFELGKYCRDYTKRIIVGCDPEYKRIQDVVIQMQKVRTNKVHTNLNDVINDLHYALTY